MSKQQFETVAPQSDIQWINPKEDLAQGDAIEGVYVEPIETTGKFGKNTKYKILTTDRNVLGLGGGELKKRMGNVEPGSYVLITFEGFEEVEITEDEETKTVDKALWSVQKATPPYTKEVQQLIAESEAYKFKPRSQDAAAQTGGRRF
jgi:hypothetical protein